jgi:hypothetical protein
MTEEPRKPATCPNCGSQKLDGMWEGFDQVKSMTLDGEWTELEPFPIHIVCQDCGHVVEGMGHNFSIDRKAGVINFGRIKVNE